ncbi:DUF4200 domain-containing protein [Tenacibaculum sp. M341]|uniref:DUF4200 domain-containing protein n=1 Tax=Tenacibaculum sp. M341 TaxID=2530339 RepID=UPI00104D0C21|nr:DUF4200 domain-containing protein [Tenacibaculum sp. M341]TCI90160.1 hypothetical protein EYW44_14600 [Tenacibaculum sp. M341]
MEKNFPALAMFNYNQLLQFYMKKLLFTITMFLMNLIVFSQVVTTNTNAVGMEHNMLFNAQSRYKVEQTGDAKVNLNMIFDGKMVPSYPSLAPSKSSPTVITISNLPAVHTQIGGWIGWATRYWEARHFKIRGYNTYGGANEWVVFADYENTAHPTGSRSFHIKVPGGSYTKLEFTFYEANGTNGRLGISELFFLHPEATTPYKGLLGKEVWNSNGDNISFQNGSVGIRTNTPGAVLDVNGSLRAGDGNWGIMTVNGKDKNDWAFNAHSDGKSFHIRSQTDGGTVNSRLVMTMDRLTGNIGINSPTPKSKLHVRNGTSGAIPHDYSDLTIEDSSHGMISILTPNDKKAYFGFADPQDNYVGGMEYEHSNDRLIFRSNNHNADMVIDKNGDVAIGTTDTQGFKLGVNGRIAATEVKVAKYEHWADFVFEEDYDLPTLKEVEKHIEEKGYLENIPSAEEIKKDGFFLGEMDAKLLRKIEELTLYTIQQEKKLTEQDEELKKTSSNNEKLLSIIEKLEKRIEKLESK